MNNDVLSTANHTPMHNTPVPQTKKVKLNMHNKYLAHVAPQSATILNSSLNYRVLLQNKISFLKNDEEVNSISLRNQSLILAIFGPNISRLGNGCRFWLVDAVLVFLQLFFGVTFSSSSI